MTSRVLSDWVTHSLTPLLTSGGVFGFHPQLSGLTRPNNHTATTDLNDRGRFVNTDWLVKIVTLYAKSSLILEGNKTGFDREGHKCWPLLVFH